MTVENPQLEPAAGRHVVFVCTGNTCRSPFAEFAAARLQSEASARSNTGLSPTRQSTATEAPASSTANLAPASRPTNAQVRAGFSAGVTPKAQPTTAAEVPLTRGADRALGGLGTSRLSATYSSAGTHVVADLGFDENMSAEFSHLFPASAPQHKATAVELGSAFHSRQLTGEIVHQAAVLIAMTREHRRWIINEFPEAQNRTFLLKPLALMCQAGLVSGWDVPTAQTIEQSPEGAQFFTDTFRDDVTDPYRMGLTEAHRSAQEITDLLRTILQSEA